jgi:omega-6 fatty acid desaturase (delta-12 desaturase)
MSLITIADSVLPYLFLWYAMYRFLSVSYWISFALAIPAAGFLIRVFIIFHDCGHGSFFRSRKLCNAVGTVLGALVFTPYWKWTREHAVHHVTIGDLDRRGTGDVWTLTELEYSRAPRHRRILYRIYRNPLFLFTIGSFFLFSVLNRFHKKFRDTRDLIDIRRDLISVYGTDVALAVAVTLLSVMIGIRAVALVQLPILFIAASAGVWLFYIQHQFDGVYWCRHGEWDYATIALKGASYYKLPGILQWFSGNIGFHHVHHLSPRIPSYRLPSCHRENALFRVSVVVTLRGSLRAARLKLWDERNREFISFHKLEVKGTAARQSRRSSE